MQTLFCDSARLRALEMQMQQPPGYRPRGHGISIMGDVEWQVHGSYADIVDYAVSWIQFEQLRSRIQEIFSAPDPEVIFCDAKHRKIFCTQMMEERKWNPVHTTEYAAAVFLLTAEEALWKKVRGNVMNTGIYFDRMRIGGVTLEQYILFHAARDIYNGTRHIQLSELTDRELVSDDVLRLIINASVIAICGAGVIEMGGRA